MGFAIRWLQNETENPLFNDTDFLPDCPEELCPSVLLNNGVCNARCNNKLCNFDNGECDNLGEIIQEESPFEALARNVFYAVMGFGIAIVLYSFVRGFCTTYYERLQMTPLERLLLCLRIKTREDITGESPGEDNDGTSGGDAEEDGVQFASPVTVALEVNRAMRDATRGRVVDEEEEEEDEDIDEEDDGMDAGFLPLANRASVDSGALPTAAEYALSSMSVPQVQGAELRDQLVARLQTGAAEADETTEEPIEPTDLEANVTTPENSTGTDGAERSQNRTTEMASI